MKVFHHYVATLQYLEICHLYIATLQYLEICHLYIATMWGDWVGALQLCNKRNCK